MRFADDAPLDPSQVDDRRPVTVSPSDVIEVREGNRRVRAIVAAVHAPGRILVGRDGGTFELDWDEGDRWTVVTRAHT